MRFINYGRDFQTFPMKNFDRKIKYDCTGNVSDG